MSINEPEVPKVLRSIDCNYADTDVVVSFDLCCNLFPSMCQGSKQIFIIIKNLNCFKTIQSTILERASKSDLMKRVSTELLSTDFKPFILLYNDLLNADGGR